MRRGSLLGVPARADLDFAILAAITVANDEMVAQPAAGECEGAGGSAGGGGMVDIDEFPVVGLGGDAGFEDFVKEGAVVGSGEAVEAFGGERGWGQEQKQGAGQGKHRDEAGKDDDFSVRTHDKAQKATRGF